MKAVVCLEGELKVEELAEPEPGPGQVLLEVLRCGICGSDLHLRHHCDHMKSLAARTGSDAQFPTSSDPIVFGHEFCCEIIDFGPQCSRKLKRGARIVAQPILRTARGIENPGLSKNVTGAYAERMVLQESVLEPVPNGLSSELAALTEPMAVGWHAVQRSDIRKKDVAVVIGCGPVGLAVICGLKAHGVRAVVASDFSSARRKLAKDCGADVVIDPAVDSPYASWEEYGHFMSVPQLLDFALETRESLHRLPLPWWQVWRVAERVGGPPARPVIFECVGLGIIQQIVDSAPLMSRVVVVGVCMQVDRFEPALAVMKEIDLRFVINHTPLEYRDSLHMIADGKLNCAPLLTGEVGLEGVDNAFAALADAESHAKILINPERRNGAGRSGSGDAHDALETGFREQLTQRINEDFSAMKAHYARRLALCWGLCLSSAIFAADTPQRSLYWGELHVHTSWSLDAYVFGNTLTGPEDFYRYAQGQRIYHPGGFEVQISKPLDWGAVTEHSDYMGLPQMADDPDSALRTSSAFMAWLLRFGLEKDPLLTFKILTAAILFGHSIDAFTGPEMLSPVWDGVVRAADQYYQPGEFTTFPAFEWTATPNSSNLHRNVLFLDSAKVPAQPFTSLDSMRPEDLWAWMDAQRAAGNEALAVSHNGNLSSGRMYPRDRDELGNPLGEEWAQARLRNEPLAEIKQGKGQSETTPLLSPNDEFAYYEVLEWQLLGARGKPPERGNYIRQAYRDGLALRQARGFNPYRFGLVGGSDSHVTAAPYRQDNYFGLHGAVDDTAEERVNGATELGLSSLSVSPGGLSGVWAEANTRESIFAALKRKETYATSGTRIALRFFGGWHFDPELLDHAEWTDTAYATGVPMGGELPHRSAAAPSFAIQASRDPAGANLDRIQVVKGWSRNGESFEKIYDVVWAGERAPDPVTGALPAIGSNVDPGSDGYARSIGAPELKTVWSDPDFEPDLDAVYYVRVLEIPTPRWSTLQAAQLGRPPPTGQGFTPLVQERAWSSPLWYSPGRIASGTGPNIATTAGPPGPSQ